MVLHHDIESAQQVQKPKYLICSQQTKDRTSAPDKKITTAFFDNFNLRKYHVEIDSIQYPRGSLPIKYEQNDYIGQFKNLKLFLKEYNGEPFLNPPISYPDMKTKYPIEITDLRHQPVHITPKIIQLYQEYGTDLDNARLFLILIRRIEIKLISDGNKLFEVKI